ncbi:p-hydroxybenzoic acid efflux pump subunit AaeB [mine drainage metagenome]|uniref:p-hydroxybenzoic acid efflux pump subunit AaeB n=1 Tax=mine drainage metagenome TaxID=410659 RepID=A0A1J5SUZ4_9ZZZZ
MRDWWRDDAPTIIYIIKVLIACLLAMWLSLRFELDQPRTAMLTVAIVMQSRTGMVFAKSYYRLLGSIVGIIVSFVLVALFAQERVLFLLAMAIWIGFCTAGSMVFRHHQSYAFVLAGYTICIVGLPATINPELTFSIGVTRISEIMIGLISASLVSDLIFPQRMGEILTAAVRRRYKDFSDLVRSMSIERISGSSSKSAALRIVSDVFELETFRASSGLENDESRAYRFRLSMLNSEFMSVSTSFHTLEQLLRRQHATGHPQVTIALFHIYNSLKEVISIDNRSIKSSAEAQQIASALKAFRATLPQQLSTIRKNLPSNLISAERLDFETGAELLQRFIDELYAYTSTYASLSDKSNDDTKDNISERPPRLGMHFDPLAVSLAGVRGALSLAAMACLWLFADWGSGIEAITIGIITSTLFASSPNPSKTVKQFIIGALLGTVLVYFCNFRMLPHAQGFLMLSIAVTPAIALAAWLTTRPAIATIGSGIFIVFLMHIGFNSTYSANPIDFLNDALADILAITTSGILFALIDLTTSRWSRVRVSKALRELVVSACLDALPQHPSRLETKARDLIQRLSGDRHVADAQDKEVIDWLLSTLEIGRAVIELRDQMNEVNDSTIKQHFAACLERIAELYALPSTRNRIFAIAAINDATAMLDNIVITTKLPQFTHQQLLTMLHFIRCALLDDDSALSLQAPIPSNQQDIVYAS